jgi:membrane fusion protein, copper/silver efflux system
VASKGEETIMKFKLCALGMVALLLMGTGRLIAHGNERGEAKATIDKAQVMIDYGRPTLKGRDVLKLISPGKIWRIGSDAPTTIESNVDLDFGGTRVPRGKHILLARLATPGQWSLVISSKDASAYEPSSRIAEVPLELHEESSPVDELTILLSSDGGHGTIQISWGSARLVARFSAAK